MILHSKTMIVLDISETAVVWLAGTLIPAGLTAVTLHTYWSHCDDDDDDDDDKFTLVMLSLVRVMLVLEVVNTVTTLVLVLVTVTV